MLWKKTAISIFIAKGTNSTQLQVTRTTFIQQQLKVLEAFKKNSDDMPFLNIHTKHPLQLSCAV
jgi:hypothetical protein